MSFFKKRNLLIGIAAFLVGTFAVAMFFGFPLIRRESSVTGKISNVLLDREGRANGMILDNGMQINFSPETGKSFFTAAAKIGDDVSAIGSAGTKTDYGQAFHAEQLTVNGQTFTEIREPRRPKGDKPRPPRDHREDKPHSPRHGRKDSDEDKAMNPPDAPKPEDTDAAPENAPEPPKTAGENLTASGTIQRFLVTMRGDVDGAILASGEQIRFSPKIGEQLVSNKAEANSPIAAEGTGVKNELGTILEATKMTIGSQTFTIND